MSSLAEEYPKEQERCRELLEQYKELGPPGTFGYIMLKDFLKRADKAVAEQDVVAMIACYKEMKECQ